MPSVARNSLARFCADSSGLVLGTATGIITARWLGPAGKGLLSAIVFLSGFCVQMTLIGLGDSAIVAIRQRKTSMEEALGTSVTLFIPVALAGMAIFYGASRFEFRQDWLAARTAVAVAALLIPFNFVNQVVVNIINAEERFVFSSILLATSSVTILLATWLFVVVLRWSVIGAVLASIMGVGLSGMLACGSMLRRSLSFRPRISRSFLRFTLSFGPKILASNLLVTAAARLDLLVVYYLAGQGAAGQYSIALTSASIAGMMPLSLMTVSFPRLAEGEPLDFQRRTGQLNRYVIAACLVGCGAMAVGMPVLIPFAFGNAYRLAITPGLVLLIGTFFGATQYNLSRAWAARGNPKILFVSHLIMTVVMITTDFLFIPRFGIMAAAVGSTVGQLAGCSWCVVEWVSKGGRAKELVPAVRDFIGACHTVSGLLTGSRVAPPTASMSTAGQSDSR